MTRAARLSTDERRELLVAAREAIARHLDTGESPRPLPGSTTEARGIFVTLRRDHELRGCIGWVENAGPLPLAAAQCAIAAATRDPRFPPLTPAELPRTRIEISILSPPEPLRDPGEIVVGRDGLIVERAGARGLLLPQVAGEQGWDRIALLEGVCRKAGLEASAWREGATLYRFTAEVFSEDDVDASGSDPEG